MTQLIIFSDLDGTLLDSQYRFEAAIPALQKIKQLQLPLVINSSKTFAEIAEIIQALELNHPVITENGSFIVIPAKYFSNPEPIKQTLGCHYQTLVEQLQQCHQQGFKFTGFHQWDKQTLVGITGLSKVMAAKALNRQGSIPILWQDTSEQLLQFHKILSAQQISLVKGGRFLHVMGQTDKGIAVKALLKYYQTSHCTQYCTIGLGDHENDLPMLAATTIAVMLPQTTGEFAIKLDHPQLIQAPHPGPKGWEQVMSKLLNQFEQQGTLPHV
ncbi:HAD-IIB family hydrolase [Spartinivicinus ruber]|uniref:HAD-IIB family hydrolase n=1 Tax=Spartinivicinus ruber TaxID=2683272 RepID=UPI0013D416D0|nr:HAD-IIB family hydrolase [Spartinivicinus ruber]